MANPAAATPPTATASTATTAPTGEAATTNGPPEQATTDQSLPHDATRPSPPGQRPAADPAAHRRPAHAEGYRRATGSGRDYFGPGSNFGPRNPPIDAFAQECNANDLRPVRGGWPAPGDARPITGGQPASPAKIANGLSPVKINFRKSSAFQKTRPKASPPGYRDRGRHIFFLSIQRPLSRPECAQLEHRRNGRPLLFQVPPPVDVDKTPRGAIEIRGFVDAAPRHKLQPWFYDVQ